MYSKTGQNIKNDNICFLNYNSLVRKLPDIPEDSVGCNLNTKSEHKDHIKVVYTDFKSHADRPFYFIAIDFLKKKIVITIRGTESLKDSITDMQWRSAQMPCNSNGPEAWYSHEVNFFYKIKI